MAQTLGQLEGVSGASRIRWLELIAWLPRSRTTDRSGLNAWPTRPRHIRRRRAVGRRCCLFTRDIVESGLVCQHCAETAVPFEEIPPDLRAAVQDWADKYALVHAVAHWDDRQRKAAGDYDRAFDRAASKAERLLATAGREILPKFLDIYPAIVWEDQDECLEVRPEDLPTP